MSFPAPDDGYTVALLDVNEGIWRCSLCGWEVETDDGVRGYCSEGHHIDCTNTPDFKAADECISDGDSIVSSEGWDEYEEDGWIDDDRYKLLAQLMKHIDESNCDATFLGQVFDEIDSIEDGYKVLLQHIVFIDLEDSEDEESADESSENESNDGEMSIEAEKAVDKGECEEIETWGVDIEETTRNDWEMVIEGENAVHKGGGEERENLGGEIEEATGNEDDDDEESEEDSESGEDGEESNENDEDGEESKAGGLKVAWLTPPDQRTLAESEAFSTISGQQLLLDTRDLEAVIMRRREFRRHNEEHPPQNAEEDDELESDHYILNDELATAIKVIRLERNELKRRLMT